MSKTEDINISANLQENSIYIERHILKKLMVLLNMKFLLISLSKTISKLSKIIILKPNKTGKSNLLMLTKISQKLLVVVMPLISFSSKKRRMVNLFLMSIRVELTKLVKT